MGRHERQVLGDVYVGHQDEMPGADARCRVATIWFWSICCPFDVVGLSQQSSVSWTGDLLVKLKHPAHTKAIFNCAVHASVAASKD